MSEELKLCPFCGGLATRHTIGEEEPSNAGGDVIVCTRCGASSHVEFGRKENLTLRWNTRADFPGITDPAAFVQAARRCVEALESLIAACDRGRMVPKPGAGVCGMSIDAQTRASCINGVDAWPVEEAREAYDAFCAAKGETM